MRESPYCWDPQEKSALLGQLRLQAWPLLCVWRACLVEMMAITEEKRMAAFTLSLCLSLSGTVSFPKQLRPLPHWRRSSAKESTGNHWGPRSMLLAAVAVLITTQLLAGGARGQQPPEAATTESQAQCAEIDNVCIANLANAVKRQVGLSTNDVLHTG